MPTEDALGIGLSILVIGAAFYVFFILPQQVTRRRQEKLIRELSVGDEVVTMGGIIGWIRRIEEGEAVLDLGHDVYVRVLLSGISHKRPGGGRVESLKASEGPPERSRKRPRRK